MDAVASILALLDSRLDAKLAPLATHLKGIQEQLDRVERAVKERPDLDKCLEVEHSQVLQRYLKENCVSTDLSERIWGEVSALTSACRTKIPEASVDLLYILSEPLLVELHAEIHVPVLTRHPLFQCVQQADPSMFSFLCHTGVTTRSLAAGDELFWEGEFTDSMCFVTFGSLEYNSCGKVSEFSEGHWFSEMALWVPWDTKGTLIARMDSQLLLLYADSFERCVSDMGLDVKLPLLLYARSCLAQLRAHDRCCTDAFPDAGTARRMAEGAFKEAASEKSAAVLPTTGLRGFWSKLSI